MAYVVAIGLLCLHLRHGIYSMFQTLGVAHPRWTPRIKCGSYLDVGADFSRLRLHPGLRTRRLDRLRWSGKALKP